MERNFCSELLIQGGNRAGKSEFAAKRVVQALTEKRNAKVWVLGMTAQSSVRDQQPLVYKYIPEEWKSLKKTIAKNVVVENYRPSQANNTLFFSCL